MPGFVGMELPDWVAERLHKGLAGVCLFGTNVGSRHQLRSLTDAMRLANPHVVIAIDEEGGDVTRLYHDRGSPYPGSAVLGRINDLALTEAVGRTVAGELAAVGCTLNFAPDADVNSNPDNPVIGTRSFGSTPHGVAEQVAAWVRGHEQAGIAVSAKHFPGHGDTAADSHLDHPVIDVDLATLRERELLPFRAAIAAGARTIMTSHILIPSVDPEFPATHSQLILGGLLRGELGFEGVIVSDALDMTGASGRHGIPEAAVRALVAGCDLLCLGSANTDDQLSRIEDAVLAAIGSGRLPVGRVQDAARRVRELGAATAGAVHNAAVEAEPQYDLLRVVSTFELSPRAEEWIAAGLKAEAVVRIDTVANIAVGVTPWGPFAELALRQPPPASVWLYPVALSEAAPLADSVTNGRGPVVVVGKDIHRHSFARAAVDELRESGRPVLVVDMGWPSADPGYADVASYGASRLIGAAVLHLLDEPTAEPRPGETEALPRLNHG